MLMCKKAIIWLWFVLLALLSFGCQGLGPSYEFKGNLVDPPLPIADFELAQTNGQPFHLSDVQGNIALIYFGYTYCPDVCPLTLWDVREAIAALETGQDQVKVIFISVDPERDTPEVLDQYLTSFFGAEAIGLTDDIEKVNLAMQPFGVYAAKEEPTTDQEDYLVSHTARLFLLDAEGEMLLQYPFGFAAEDLTSDLAHLLR